MRALTVDVLRDMLLRKITRDGKEVYPRSTTKAPLLNSLCTASRTLLFNLQRRFVSEQLVYLASMLHDVLRNPNDGMMEVRRIGAYVINKAMLRGPLNDTHVAVIMLLFQNEDNAIVKQHHERYSRPAPNAVYVPFVGSLFMMDMFSNPRNIDLMLYHSVYLAVKTTIGVWIIIVVDKVTKRYRVMLPFTEVHNPINLVEIAAFLNSYMYPTGLAGPRAVYTCEVYMTLRLAGCDAYDRLDITAHDLELKSVVYLFVFLLCAVHECPIVLSSNHIDWYREKLLYSISCGALYF